MDAEIRRIAYRFRRPITTAHGTLAEREVLVLRLRDEDGNEGLGEAAPLAPYDGVSLDAARDALECAVADPRSSASTGIAPADAALDVALWDLAGGARPGPMGDSPAPTVLVNATIAALEPAEAAREALAAAEQGFATVKLKVGVGDDLARVAAVRAAVGADVAIRVDANGAWDVEQAVATLRSLARSDIELCEEPVHGVAQLAAVRERLDGEVAIAMDETARETDAIASGAADYVCLKVAGCGGITGVWKAAERARAAGSRAYLASTYDGPVGIAAGLHAAAALGPGLPACGLATLSLFEGVDDPFPAREGRIEVPRGPGLGISWPVG